jgi:transposase
MIEPTPLSSNSQNINASLYLNSAKYLKGTDIRAIKEDINRHLPIRDIAKKYHISFSVYSQIKNSAMDKGYSERNSEPRRIPQKGDHEKQRICQCENHGK